MTRPADTLSVGVHEAKTHLSRLIDRVLSGEEVTIERRGEPVVKLVRIESSHPPVFGSDAGRVVIHADFDDPLPAGVAGPLGAEDAPE